jgi:hypothetical protein
MQRIQRHPLMAVFDGPDTGASTGSRVTSTTTLQALYFLNDPFVHEQATRLAERLRSSGESDDGRIATAYQLLYSRGPAEHEKTTCRDHLAKVRSQAASDPKADGESLAWESLVRVLLRTNEFVYVD